MKNKYLKLFLVLFSFIVLILTSVIVVSASSDACSNGQHYWSDSGVCIECGYSCSHEDQGGPTIDQDGNCMTCGTHQKHIYNKKDTDLSFRASSANCTTPAMYYYSCWCGAKGTDTFSSGSSLGHKWESSGQCSVCGAECQHSYSGTDCTVCGNHKHIYDQKSTSTTYRISSATCISPAKFYYSCNCGAKGTETFTNGNALGHKWEASGQCSVCSAECQHSYNGTDCTVCGNHKHIFDQRNADPYYKATSATCTSSATYYYSCICSVKGTTTFTSGNALGHNWVASSGECAVCGAECTHSFSGTDCTVCGSHRHIYDQKSTSTKYLISSATCISPAKFHYSCNCGAEGTETFTNGNALGHEWNPSSGQCDECQIDCEHDYDGAFCLNCGTHQHVYSESGKCIICEIPCVHLFESDYDSNENYHWAIQKCSSCGFSSVLEAFKTPHSFGESGITCSVCFYDKSAPEDETTTGGSDACVECENEFSHLESIDSEWHARIGKCTICGKLSELIREKHNFNSDGICADCGEEAPEETEPDSPSEETEKETVSENGSTSEDNKTSNKNKFDLFLLIPATALIGAVAIVIVLVARKRKLKKGR